MQSLQYAFYAGRYTQESLPEKPSKVWVLRTKKENDVCRSKLGKEYQISGDDFYYAENGDKPVLPLGTVSIEETKAPKGYMLGKGLYRRRITENLQKIIT